MKAQLKGLIAGSLKVLGPKTTEFKMRMLWHKMAFVETKLGELVGQVDGLDGRHEKQREVLGGVQQEVQSMRHGLSSMSSMDGTSSIASSRTSSAQGPRPYQSKIGIAASKERMGSTGSTADRDAAGAGTGAGSTATGSGATPSRKDGLRRSSDGANNINGITGTSSSGVSSSGLSSSGIVPPIASATPSRLIGRGSTGTPTFGRETVALAREIALMGGSGGGSK
jgi:hypothetical protein